MLDNVFIALKQHDSWILRVTSRFKELLSSGHSVLPSFKQSSTQNTQAVMEVFMNPMLDGVSPTYTAFTVPLWTSQAHPSSMATRTARIQAPE